MKIFLNFSFSLVQRESLFRNFSLVLVLVYLFRIHFSFSLVLVMKSIILVR